MGPVCGNASSNRLLSPGKGILEGSFKNPAEGFGIRRFRLDTLTVFPDVRRDMHTRPGAGASACPALKPGWSLPVVPRMKGGGLPLANRQGAGVLSVRSGARV